MVHKTMDWFKEKCTGTPHRFWEKLRIPLDDPLNQSFEQMGFRWYLTLEGGGVDPYLSMAKWLRTQ